jgi:hypothetical protein
MVMMLLLLLLLIHCGGRVVFVSCEGKPMEGRYLMEEKTKKGIENKKRRNKKR